MRMTLGKNPRNCGAEFTKVAHFPSAKPSRPWVYFCCSKFSLKPGPESRAAGLPYNTVSPPHSSFGSVPLPRTPNVHFLMLSYPSIARVDRSLAVTTQGLPPPRTEPRRIALQHPPPGHENTPRRPRGSGTLCQRVQREGCFGSSPIWVPTATIS